MKLLRIYILIGVLLTVISCSESYNLLNPNPIHPVYDLPHYRHDTLKFYQVELPIAMVNSLDTIIQNCKIQDHRVWILSGRDKNFFGRVEYDLSTDVHSNIYIVIDKQKLPYYAARIGDVKLLVLDFDNVFRIKENADFLTFYNRKLHSGYSRKDATTWNFELKNEEAVFRSRAF